MTLHVTLFEAIAAAACVWGLWYTRTNYLHAQRNVISVRASGDAGVLLMMAKRKVRVRFVLLRLEQVWLAVSLIALFLPPPPFPTLDDLTLNRQSWWGGVIVRVAITYTALMIARLSKIDYVEEAEIIEVVSKAGAA